MKKIFGIFVFFFSCSICYAQLTTYSNYDVDCDGSVTVDDVTKLVDKVLGKDVLEKRLVEAERVEALLMQKEEKLDSLQRKLNALTDPYNGHEYVDLGLSVKWATMNVGASSPEKYGDYYAWGELQAKDYYGWETYKWMIPGRSSWTGLNKYTLPDKQTMANWYQGGKFVGDNKGVLSATDDIAYKSWGGAWRMPTEEEWDELRDNCVWVWTNVKGVNGFKVMTEDNSRYIFLPATGCRKDGFANDGLNRQGMYWSSSLVPYYSDCVYLLNFSQRNIERYFFSRCYGLTVRPVCP